MIRFLEIKNTGKSITYDVLFRFKMLFLAKCFHAFQYVHKLGLSKDWKFVDVWSLDTEMLGLVPQPVAAVLLLYPLTEKVGINFWCLRILCSFRY